jgi:hypothetical protein
MKVKPTIKTPERQVYQNNVAFKLVNAYNKNEVIYSGVIPELTNANTQISVIHIYDDNYAKFTHSTHAIDIQINGVTIPDHVVDFANLLQNVRLHFDNLTFVPNYHNQIPFVLYSMEIDNSNLILTITGAYKTTIK